MSHSKYFAHSLLVCALLLLCASSPARADTIVLQTGFESDTPGVKTGGALVGDGQFALSGANVIATVAGLADEPFCSSLGLSPQCFGIRGDPGFLAAITSVNTFAPGDYQLMFDVQVGGAPMTVALGNFSQTLSGITPAQTRSFSFTLTSTANLVFSVSLQAALDNIRLTRIEQTEPIPEPTTMLLLGTGLAGIGMKLRKRRQAKTK